MNKEGGFPLRESQTRGEAPEWSVAAPRIPCYFIWCGKEASTRSPGLSPQLSGGIMEGHCLCGGITVSSGDHKEVNLCHCAMCRRWSGGPMFAVHGGKGVRFTGMTPVAYRSSEWAERGFCPTCGTHLFYHLLPTDEYILSAGLFQDQGFELTGQIFIDEKPDFYALKNDTPTLTGQQVFEQFAPKP